MASTHQDPPDGIRRGHHEDPPDGVRRGHHEDGGENGHRTGEGQEQGRPRSVSHDCRRGLWVNEYMN